MLKKLGLLLLLVTPIVWGFSAKELQTQPVAEDSGDTIETFVVTLDSFTPKVIDAGNVSLTTNGVGLVKPTVRRRTIKNLSAFTVYLGSASVINSNWANFGFQLGEATNTANSNQFSTQGNGAIYGACLAPNVSCTVNLIKESNPAY